MLLGFVRGERCGDAGLHEDAPPLFGQRRAALRIEAADFHVGAGADRLARERQMLVVEGDGDAGLEAFLDTEVDGESASRRESRVRTRGRRAPRASRETAAVRSAAHRAAAWRSRTAPERK